MLHEQKLKEVEWLKYEAPSWARLLLDMFKDVAIDFGAMLGTVAARDSDDTPAPKIHRNEHQAAARGEVVANSNRLLTARPRRSNHLCPHQAVVG